ncbi:MAG: hypothetical protein AAB706_03805 [Patescibacteria group bacterium]
MKKKIWSLRWVLAVAVVFFVVKVTTERVNYLAEENKIFLFVTDWLLPLVIILITLLPFFFVRIKKIQPVRWWWIFWIYPLSFWLSNFIIELFWKFEDWLYLQGINYYSEIGRSLSEVPLIQDLSLIVLWPLSMFYLRGLIYEKFTLKSWFVVLAASTGFFAFLAHRFFVEMIEGLGAFAKYL